MTDRELMQQALDALENLQGLCTDAQDGWVEAVTIWTPEIIAALRERLAQPEQEPVAWRSEEVYSPDVGSWFEYYDEFRQCSYRNDLTPLYTTPPQRKPLSDEEIQTYRHMIDWTAEWSYIKFARAIEQAHNIRGQS